MSFSSSPKMTKEVDTFAKDAVTHLDALYGVACKLTRNPSEAEDLVQDTLLKAMRARALETRHCPSHGPSGTPAARRCQVQYGRSTQP